jgi:hypothetical protein
MNTFFMKIFFCFLIVLGAATATLAQGPMAEMKFHEGSSLFINGKTDLALRSVNEGLRQDPAHTKLKELKKLLEDKKKDEQKKEQEKKEQEKKQQEEQKKEQQKKDQQKKDQEKQDQQKQEEQKKEDQEKKDQEEKKDDKEKTDKEKAEEQKEQEQKEQDKKDELPPEVKERLEKMKMSEEKAKMILEALKNREVQYLQENKRKGTQRQQSGKPDW